MLSVDAYLLILRSVVDDVGHQDGQQFRHSVDTSGESPISRGTSRWLTGLASCLYPLSSYRVYDIEYAQLVCSWSLLEMRVDLLD